MVCADGLVGAGAVRLGEVRCSRYSGTDCTQRFIFDENYARRLDPEGPKKFLRGSKKSTGISHNVSHFL